LLSQKKSSPELKGGIKTSGEKEWKTGYMHVLHVLKENDRLEGKKTNFKGVQREETEEQKLDPEN